MDGLQPNLSGRGRGVKLQIVELPEAQQPALDDSGKLVLRGNPGLESPCVLANHLPRSEYPGKHRTYGNQVERNSILSASPA